MVWRELALELLAVPSSSVSYGKLGTPPPAFSDFQPTPHGCRTHRRRPDAVIDPAVVHKLASRTPQLHQFQARSSSPQP